MRSQKTANSYTSFYLRAPQTLDDVLEEMARRERRTKTAVIALSLEEHCEKHHPDLYAKCKEGTP